MKQHSSSTFIFLLFLPRITSVRGAMLSYAVCWSFHAIFECPACYSTSVLLHRLCSCALWGSRVTSQKMSDAVETVTRLCLCRQVDAADEEMVELVEMEIRELLDKRREHPHHQGLCSLRPGRQEPRDRPAGYRGADDRSGLLHPDTGAGSGQAVHDARGGSVHDHRPRHRGHGQTGARHHQEGDGVRVLWVQ